MDKSEKKESFGKKYGLILALIAMAIVYLFPTPVDLPTQGHRLIGILVFAVIIWMTEGVSYPVSAFVIVTFMAFALGMAPDPAKHGALLGTSKALQMGLSGFSTTAWALVAAAMFLSAGMMITGLDKRIALVVMSHVGVKSSRLVIGVIFVGFILSFFVPSTTARVSCMVPIVVASSAHSALKRDPRCSCTDDGRRSGRQPVEHRHQDSSSTEHGCYRIHPAGSRQGYQLAGMVHRRCSLCSSYVCHSLSAPDPCHATGNQGNAWRQGSSSENAEGNGTGIRQRKEAAHHFLSASLLLGYRKELHPFDTTTVTITGIMLMMLPRIGS